MLLYLDTTNQDKPEIAAAISADKIFRQQISNARAEDLPNVIAAFLRKHKLKFSDVEKLAVRTGGSFFSAIRQGVVAANALAFALKVPIVPTSNFNFQKIMAQKGQGMLKPIYSSGPHITKPKKRQWLP
ncbi:MAG TPA: hypothetical protein VFX17_02540 [Patescibacteria group bacterium]|nr:hypothetical protein [Patescibacteria group bacterium]